jgi:cell division protein FtsQ
MRLALYKENFSDKQAKQPRRFRYRILAGIFCIGIMLSASAVWWWRDGIADRLITISADAGIKLEGITVFGRINTEQDDILSAIGLKRGDPMLGINLDQIKSDIEQLGWVSQARVERHFPSDLVIYLTERRPIAIYQTAAGHQVIDKSGEIIKGIKVEDFRHLPVISGKSAQTRAGEIIAILESEADLYNEVWSLAYRSERRWDVFLGNNIRIMLPEQNPMDAWSQLAKLDRQHKLTKRNTVDIDLRIPGQIIIKPDQPVKAKGSQT